MGHRKGCGAVPWASVCVALLSCFPALAQIDLDANSSAGALTYSKELLIPSTDVRRGFYKVGTFGSGDLRLVTRATLGDWTVLASSESGLWIRYDLDEHLTFHGTTAPRLSSQRPNPDDSNETIDVLDGGLAAANAARFVRDGYLLFSYKPSQQFLPRETILELDLANVLGTSGRGDGRVRVRAFRSVDDALDDTNPFRVEKEATVVRVANTITVTPREVTQSATVLDFTQFALGNRVPLGGFEIGIDDSHRAPDGSPVPGTTTVASLRQLNVDVEASSLSLEGDGGFAFAPADGGWTIEDVDPETGLCDGDGEQSRAVSPLGFGTDDVDYPAGPARSGLPPLSGFLCATVPADNDQTIRARRYYLNVSFVPVSARPFPPTGVSDALVGTVKHQATTVHIPYLTFAEGYVQRLTIVNRNLQDVEYRLTLQPGKGGRADPPEIEGVAVRGVTTLRLGEVTTLTGANWASATLLIVSNPGRVDIATVTVSRDQSTDTVVYKGSQDVE